MLEISIPEILIRDRRSNRSTIELYVLLRDNPESLDWTYEELGRRLSVSKSHIQTNLKRLEELGMIVEKRRELVGVGDETS